MRIRQGLLAAGRIAAAVAACSDTLSPSPRNVDGTWAEEGEVPGSSNVWTLSVSGTDVVGTGTWSGEACCGGTLAIVGAYSRRFALSRDQDHRQPVCVAGFDDFTRGGPALVERNGRLSSEDSGFGRISDAKTVVSRQVHRRLIVRAIEPKTTR